MFHRDKSKAVLGGVCAGIAEAMDVSPGLVRFLTIVVALVTAVLPALLVYAVLWLIVPSE